MRYLGLDLGSKTLGISISDSTKTIATSLNTIFFKDENYISLIEPLKEIIHNYNNMLFDQISNDIKEAMKARDKVRLETLRNVKKVFLEAKTAPGANDELTDEAALKIIQKLAKQGRDAASIYEGQGRADLAADELAQVSVLEGYMPKQMSAEELSAALSEIIAQVGAAGPQDMGKVMGVATKQLAGRAEGRAISVCVKELLAK